jgi:hypothetical protein
MVCFLPPSARIPGAALLNGRQLIALNVGQTLAYLACCVSEDASYRSECLRRISS